MEYAGGQVGGQFARIKRKNTQKRVFWRREEEICCQKQQGVAPLWQDCGFIKEVSTASLARTSENTKHEYCFPLIKNQGASLVYHPQCIAVYHQHRVLDIIIAKGCNLWLMIYTCGDDMQTEGLLIYHRFRNG